jgi:hypothetical protein
MQWRGLFILIRLLELLTSGPDSTQPEQAKPKDKHLNSSYLGYYFTREYQLMKLLPAIGCFATLVRL